MDFCELGSVRDMIETTNKVLNEEQINVRSNTLSQPHLCFGFCFVF